jgi:dienelactone hydrolase
VRGSDGGPAPTTSDAKTYVLDDAQTSQRDDSGGRADAGSAGQNGTHTDAAAQGGTLDAGGASADGGERGPRVDTSSPQLYELALDPHVLDPSTKDSLSTQYAQLDTRSLPLGKLVIFLPGATNVPRDWRDHGRKLAEYGFHVLIPHYNNRWSSDDTCTGMGNACGDNTRWEALVGEDASPAVDIARADSAEGRVITMLKYLASAQPGGDWGYYLSARDELQYAKTVIAGISHGAASAGMYAARRAFSRNVMHSSGAAGSATGAKLTPISEWFGFAHEQDPAYSAIVSSWNSFGLPGQPVNVDGQAAPFTGSHRLSTSASSTYPHGSVCVHSSSPKDAAGNYLFESAWRYLYGVAAK